MAAVWQDTYHASDLSVSAEQKHVLVTFTLVRSTSIVHAVE